MAAYDHEWVFEDDHEYQLAISRPEPQLGFSQEDEDAYWASHEDCWMDAEREGFFDRERFYDDEFCPEWEA